MPTDFLTTGAQASKPCCAVFSDALSDAIYSLRRSHKNCKRTCWSQWYVLFWCAFSNWNHLKMVFHILHIEFQLDPCICWPCDGSNPGKLGLQQISCYIYCICSFHCLASKLFLLPMHAVNTTAEATSKKKWWWYFILFLPGTNSSQALSILKIMINAFTFRLCSSTKF